MGGSAGGVERRYCRRASSSRRRLVPMRRRGAWTWVWGSTGPPASVYLALDRQLDEFPGCDVALLWDERHGWSLAVESPDSGAVRMVTYLGVDVLPAPRVVAQ